MNNQSTRVIKNTIGNKRHQPVRRRSIFISTLTGIGLSLLLMGNANAHCKWFHPGHCAEEVANEVARVAEQAANEAAQEAEKIANEAAQEAEKIALAAEQAAIDAAQEAEKIALAAEQAAIDAAQEAEQAANDVATFSETAVTTAVNTIEDGLEEVAKAIEDAAMIVYRQAAKVEFQQFRKPMIGMVKSWKKLVASEPAKHQRLINALKNNNGPETQAALEEVLVSLYTYAGFADIVQNFKDKNVGSLLFIVSAGGGAGVTLEGDVGLAIDIDYLIHLSNRVANGYTSSTFSGAIGSLFTAGGIQIGPAAGGGVDFVVGYHLANPDGVYGPGLDISLELKAKIGGGVGFSFDVSKAPWQIVMGGISIGAGVEVQLSIGPSYAVVLGQLCSNGSLKAWANQC